MGTYNEQVIEETVAYVKENLSSYGSSHDWEHIRRVWTNAKQIAKAEKTNLYIVELAALLHDLTDRKYYKGTEQEGNKLLIQYLEEKNIDTKTISHILEIINNMSFSKNAEVLSPEQAVVQDADRLDAIGAIGIARCMAYSGEINNPIFLPDLDETPKSIEDYKKTGSSSAIAHFYDKLFHIKDKMMTTTGRRIAEERHNFMQTYIQQFLAEYQGKR
jgi:uncharacterized protein